MKPVLIVGNQKRIIMEVIGENGQKVAEYVEKPPKERPYHILQERYTA